MALNHSLTSCPSCSLAKVPSRTRTFILPRIGNFSNPLRCMIYPKLAKNTTARRSANYQSPIWDFNFVQSLKSEYGEEVYINRINKQKEEVRLMLKQTVDPLNQLQLIDTLQRLGLAYHYEDEIKRVLMSFTHNIHNIGMREDLYATALKFRLLRQHGYDVPQAIFLDIFRDEAGNFKKCLCEDWEGMLSLYEASFLLEEGETILQNARDFTTTRLNKFVEQTKDQNISKLINHALELPLHWRMPRLETRWFIDVYERKQGMNPLLLELAKLDFNNVQITHQNDLKHMSWWWRNIGLEEKLSFARSRLIESFFWTIGLISEPQFSYCRRILTKAIALVTIIDDVYDVYGTLDELELFTDAVERWDVNAMEQLPDYMKICYLSFHNSINEIAFDVLKEQGIYIIPYLKKAWADLCKSFLLEARWFYNGHIPSLQEYIDNAWISISGHVILIHAYFLVNSPITNDALKCLKEYSNIIRYSSTIFRLANDLGTSSDELKRGDVPKSIQCYMHETGVSEAEASYHIRFLISEIWKKMNNEKTTNSPFSETFIKIAFNLFRMAQCTYHQGDGFGIVNCETKDQVLSLLIEPIPCRISAM
ncbi:terpene synthase 10 [Manihot esculenta]|uniref:terpene synthase 10 n=1 Tax=Manihot esculenta TaxID=3983 RepID=UPI001CC80702|nr:terpene synthase 10 [Manihot esculenta]